MKKIILFIAAIMLLSCTKEVTKIYVVENVTVSLKATPKIEVVENSFRSASSQHEFPTSYKAYFVSNETKGEYQAGQLVRTIDASPGTQEITIPKLNYTVYVTNYEQGGVWYTWNNATEQLPQSSDKLYLYGKNQIDYSKVAEGQVEVINPYSAVMIENNRWVKPTPKFYGDGKEYTLKDGWWLLYIRTGNTNTTIPTNIPNFNQNYELKKAIQPNKIYQYTIDASVDELNGNFSVIVKEFEDTIRETIKIN